MSTTFDNNNDEDDDQYDDPNGFLEEDLPELGLFIDWVASQTTQASQSSNSPNCRGCDWDEYQIQNEKLIGQPALSPLASRSSSTSLASSVELESDDDEGSVEWISFLEHPEGSKMSGGTHWDIFRQVKNGESPQVAKTPVGGSSKKRSGSTTKKSTKRSTSVEKRQRRAPRADDNVTPDQAGNPSDLVRRPLFPLFNQKVASAQSSFNSRRSSETGSTSTAATSFDGENVDRGQSFRDKTASDVVEVKEEYAASGSEYDDDEDHMDDDDDIFRSRRRSVKAPPPNKGKARAYHHEPVPDDASKTIRGTVRRHNQQEAEASKAQQLVLNPAFKNFKIQRPQTSVEEVATPDSSYSIGSTFEQYLQEHPIPATNLFDLPLHKVYEFTRVALSLGYRNEESTLLNLGHRYLQEMQDAKSAEDFWQVLYKIPENSEQKLPHRSLRIVPKTWDSLEHNSNDLWTNVELSGSARFVECGGPGASDSTHEIAFSLESLQSHGRSCRFWRRFGSDRFLSISIPSLKWDRLAKLNMKKQEAENSVFEWTQRDLTLFGRTWKAFYVREGDKDKPARVIWFAVKGTGLKPISIPDLVLWHIPLNGNEKLSLAKFWARIALGLSSTTAGPTLNTQADILYVKDTTNKNEAGKDVIMNDGCALASASIFQSIWKQYKLPHVPSAIQGRISGGKGIWFTTPDSVSEASEGPWMQITKSQKKYEPHNGDEDPLRLTVDICKVATTQQSAYMNRQLIPILYDRGVPRTAFAHLIIEEIQAKLGFIAENIENPLVLKRWLEGKNTGTLSTLNSGWIGSLPRSYRETARMLLDAGFELATCSFLMKTVMKVFHDEAESWTDRIHIRVARSVKVMCIADPLGVLQEGEISMRFTSPMVDEETGRVIDVLRGDVLVTRNPAHLPSDIQKVKAVDRPELSHLRDVVVFSVRGPKPLAAYLSGGDYDGDTIWVSWEPLLVKPFENAQGVQLDDFSMLIEDDVTAASLEEFRKIFGVDLSDGEFVEELWKTAMRTSFEDTHVGVVSTYYDALSYRDGSICSPETTGLARLFEQLVDAKKQGKRLKDSARSSLAAKYKDLPSPAYRAEERPAIPPTDHILDYVRFGVSYSAVDKIKRSLNQRLRDVPANDVVLTAKFNQFDQEARDLSSENSNVPAEERIEAQQMRAILRGLEDDLAELEQIWSEHFPSGQKNISPGAEAFKQELYDLFRGIRPRPVPCTRFQIISKWQTADPNDEYNEWELIKASCLFRRKPRGKMVWTLAGKQLCAIKAGSCGKSFRHVLEELYGNMKTRKTSPTSTTSAARGGDACEENQFLMNTQFLQRFEDDMESL